MDSNPRSPVYARKRTKPGAVIIHLTELRLRSLGEDVQPDRPSPEGFLLRLSVSTSAGASGRVHGAMTSLAAFIIRK